MYFVLMFAKAVVKVDLKVILRFIVGMLVFQTNAGHTDFASPIWFLIALFNVEVIYNFIRSSFSKWWGTILITVLAVAGCIYSLNPDLPILPFAIEPTVTSLLLFEIGYSVKKLSHQKYLNQLFYIIGLMLFIQILLLKLNGTIDMRSARYYN